MCVTSVLVRLVGGVRALGTLLTGFLPTVDVPRVSRGRPSRDEVQ